MPSKSGQPRVPRSRPYVESPAAASNQLHPASRALLIVAARHVELSGGDPAIVAGSRLAGSVTHPIPQPSGDFDLRDVLGLLDLLGPPFGHADSVVFNKFNFHGCWHSLVLE